MEKISNNEIKKLEDLYKLNKLTELEKETKKLLKIENNNIILLNIQNNAHLSQAAPPRFLMLWGFYSKLILIY